MARFTGGWVKLFRTTVDEDIGQNVNLLAIWVTLLCWANLFESKRLGPKIPIIISEGQILTSMDQIASHLHIPKKTVHKWLHYLARRNSILLERVTPGTRITICNWKEYQCSEEEGVTKREQKGNEGVNKGVNEGVTHIEELRTKNKEKKTLGVSRRVYPECFETFWKQYGYKGDKAEALKRYIALKLSPDEKLILGKAIGRYVARNPDKQYRKDFERFLKMDLNQHLENKQDGFSTLTLKVVEDA